VYFVNLTVTVPGGCVYQSRDTVTVLGPSGSFVYDAGFNCSPNAVMFTATASNANSYVWNFGDGNTLTSTSNIVFYTYPNPGSYVPSVRLQNTAGCSIPLTGIDTIKVDQIDAGFIYAAQQNCGSTLIQFTDTTNAFFGVNTISWDFGDGTNGTGNVVNHLYSATGLYTVTMIAIGNSGCADTSIQQINVQVNGIPVASIIADTERCAFQNIVFSANVVSTDPITIQQWRLSNGVTAVGPTFSYLFNIPGTYSLRFISGTDFGCFDTAFHTIVIRPVPLINASNSLTLCLGNTAQLNVTGASNYQWIPAQGLSCTTCPNPVASSIITTPYVVTATNLFGCAAYDTVVVTVIQPMNLVVSPNDSICIGSSSNLLATGATTYVWSPAATLSSSTAANPVATPLITTGYRVVGYDGFNCFTDTAFVIVAVGNFPTINLGPDLTLSTGTQHPLNSSITNGPISRWLWQPSTDLSCNNCPLPIATIKKDITYTVMVTSPYGCSATDTISFKTFCESAQVFIPNAFTPDGDGINDVLMVRGKGIASVKNFRIFNRWGELVFERSNFSPNIVSFGWDGRVRGVVGPPDVFVYTAEVICENGTSYVYKGNTSIIK
jgi:gliding motility-associated-like protein